MRHGNVSRMSTARRSWTAHSTAHGSSCGEHVFGPIDRVGTTNPRVLRWKSWNLSQTAWWHLTLLSQSEMWSGWRQVQQVGSIEWCARTRQSFFRLVESSTRTEWSRNPAAQVRHRWMSTPLAKERDASCADVVATERKTRARVRQRTRLTRTVPPSLKVTVAIVARKATSGQTARSVWQKRKTRKSTPLMERRRLRQWRQWKTQGGSMMQEFVGVGPMMTTAELTIPNHGLGKQQASGCWVRPGRQRLWRTHLSMELCCKWTWFGSFECAVENREWSLDSFSGRKVMVSHDVLVQND